MKNTKKLTVLSMIVLFSLIVALIFPISVLADDTTPPPAETPEVLPPTEQPVTTEEPVATEEPVIVEATPTAPAVTDVLATDEAPPAEETGDVNLAEVVVQLNDADLVLLDENGQSVPMASNEAAQASPPQIRLVVLQVFSRLHGVELAWDVQLPTHRFRPRSMILWWFRDGRFTSKPGPITNS